MATFLGDGKKPLNAYKEYVNSMAYASELQMNSLYEIFDKKSQEIISERLEICKKLAPLQVSIITSVRKQIYLSGKIQD